MAARLAAICFAAADPPALARFWSALIPDGAAGFGIRFVPSDGPRTSRNRMHFDLTSTSGEDQRRTVDLALRLGGRPADVGQRPEEPHVVLADPEGNEFCVLGPGNSFVAGCGPVGAVACDGTQRVGYFWSAALDWPLVWDRDEETAIQSPAGGTKISWGGPPVAPRTGPGRVFFELAAIGDRAAEEDRLAGLGATRLGPGELADPDGNEFHLTTDRTEVV
jgi:hypothetical protein